MGHVETRYWPGCLDYISAEVQMSILWIKCSVIESAMMQYVEKAPLRAGLGVPLVNGCSRNRQLARVTTPAKAQGRRRGRNDSPFVING